MISNIVNTRVSGSCLYFFYLLAEDSLLVEPSQSSAPCWWSPCYGSVPRRDPREASGLCCFPLGQRPAAVFHLACLNGRDYDSVAHRSR